MANGAKKASQIFILILASITAIASFVINLIVIIKYSYELNYSEQLAQNNNKSPLFVNGITLVDVPNNCPSGFSRITFGRLPKTASGCYNNETGETRKGQCSGSEVVIKAMDVQNIQAINNKYFCVGTRRNYKTVSIMKTCVGKKDCGIADNVGNHYCVEEDGSEACPVNYMILGNDEKPTFCENPSNECRIINIDEGLNFYISNKNTAGNIISQFYLGDGIPCLNTDTFVSNDDYILEENKVTDSTKCPKINDDPKYTADKRVTDDYKIGGIPRKYLFKKDQMPLGYPGDKKITLYSYPYLGYKADESKVKRQIQNEEGHKEYESNHKIYRRYALVAFICNCIAMPYSLFKIFYRAFFQKEDEEEGPTCCKTAIEGAGLVLLISTIISFVYCCYCLQSVDGYDDITKFLLNIEYDKLNFNWTLLLVLLVLNTFEIVLVLLLLFCFCCFFCFTCCCSMLEQ